MGKIQFFSIFVFKKMFLTYYFLCISIAYFLEKVKICILEISLKLFHFSPADPWFSQSTICSIDEEKTKAL